MVKGFGYFHGLGPSPQPEKIPVLPQVQTHRRESVAEGWVPLSVPRRLSNGQLSIGGEPIGHQGHDREEAKQTWRRPENRQVRPLALGLDTEVPTNLLKGHLNGPSPDKPTEVGATRRTKVEAGA